MRRYGTISCLAACLIFLFSGTALAANSIVVESKDVIAGESNVVVGVYITNDVALMAINLSFEMRSTSGGAYFAGTVPPAVFTLSTVALADGGRIGTKSENEDPLTDLAPLMDSPTLQYYNTPSAVNECSGPTSSTWTGGAAFLTPNGSPDAFFWNGLVTVTPTWFEPGTDGSPPPGAGTPSVRLTFLQMNNNHGTFVIDTMCAAPSGHTLFVDTLVSLVVSDFTMGVITIGGPPVPPVAQCQDVTVVAVPIKTGAETLNCHADASIDDGSFDPDGGAVILLQSPPGPYSLGPTLVKLLVTDDEGDTNSCQATVTVVDSTPPNLTCILEFDTAAAGENCLWSLIDYTLDSAYQADDDCDGTNLIVSQDPNPGTILGLGDHSVCIVVEDQSGNKDSCCFTVAVIDNTPPTVSCVPTIIVTIGEGQTDTVVTFVSSATDNCSSPSVSTDPPSGSVFPLGVTPVEVIATDAVGNKDTCYFDVLVRDNQAPVCNLAPVDVNCDGVVNVFDVVHVVNSAFRKVPSPGPCCLEP